MVKTLQIKFVKTAMTAVSVLLLAVICAINGIYSFNTYSREKNIAKMLADNGGIPDFEKMKQERRDGDRQEWDDRKTEVPAEGETMPSEREWEDTPPGPHDQQGHDMTDPGNFLFDQDMSPDDVMAVRYFIIRYDESGAVASADTGSIYSVTDEEAEDYGRQALEKGKESGLIGSFLYFMKDSGGAKSAAFVDVSSRISSVIQVAVISLIISAIAWLLMFVFVSVLSRRAIAPIAENIVRQKQFVTNAGHELKTPLAIIMANTEALELFGGESKWTRNIKEQTVRLNTLMQNLLTLSKMDETELNLPMQDFDLGELILESARPFEEPALKKKLSFDVQAPPIMVKANRAGMGQLIGILLDNAVKYTPEGGKISMTAYSEGKTVTIRQQNTVRPEEMEENPERLFDRFYRRDEARTQKKGGYGIGLSAARAIAAANHAQISASYTEQNIVFTVKLMI